jgi:hypothetical protein
LLRGPQTPGELKARTERMVTLESLEEVEIVLERLAEKGYARRVGRRPGQKEDRYAQLLGGPVEDSPESDFAAEPKFTDPLEERVSALELALEERLSTLERTVAELQARLG